MPSVNEKIDKVKVRELRDARKIEETKPNTHYSRLVC